MDFEARPDPDEPEDDEARPLLPLRDATARPEPERAVVLRRVVVERLLATGVTSTVVEEASASAVDAGLVLVPADALPEAFAVTDGVEAAEADAEARRREAGVAMGMI